MKTRLLAVSTLTLLVSCGGAGQPEADKEAPVQKPPRLEIVTAVTDWQKATGPGNDSRYYRLIVITTPNDNHYCAIEIDGGTMDAGASITLLGPTGCK